MDKYDGPSFYKKGHPKVEPIHGKKKSKKRPKYQLPDSVQTRDEIKKEAHQTMKTPARLNRRFRSTKIPNSLQHLEGWKQSQRNHPLIEKMRKRLEKESSEYLLFEDFMKDKPKTEPAKKNEVTLVKNDLVNIEFGQKKPNSGLHRSLSNIIAEDKQVMKKKNGNLNSLFSEENHFKK